MTSRFSLGNPTSKFFLSTTDNLPYGIVRDYNNRKGAKVSPCRTPAMMSNQSVSPSVIMTLALVLLYIELMAHNKSGGTPKASNIQIIFPLRIESKAFLNQ